MRKKREGEIRESPHLSEVMEEGLDEERDEEGYGAHGSHDSYESELQQDSIPADPLHTLSYVWPTFNLTNDTTTTFSFD